MKAEQHGDGSITIRCVLSSTAEDVRAALAGINDLLIKHGRPPGLGDMWELALAEVLNNVVEHAYRDRSDGEIRVDLKFADSCLRARIVDFGAPMPGGVPPCGKMADLDVPTEDLPEGGFGWFLIRSLANRLTYHQCDGANHLTLEIPLQCEDNSA
ncbi:ATP-binding protein [Tropicibacter naphthalenivorans]|uniref:Serine/threonine-protein kinase BtrW n=1 Tax=Tropicibacter naphthalenivorans TaxID=441103 RepID=A0A0P1GGP0_9RHOB|nr:ATP-binding protein [Tropicibacter naphthalenivorans]CUH75524.1 Serine/threonine-protein kinase BtrW [Tropicibacter naphthalenivorans]SMC43907.1 serine/threonine-protein kinase RsbW [Tropicibacter naphthalenivorans]